VDQRTQLIFEKTARYLYPDRIRLFSEFGLDLCIGRREGYRMWGLDGHELIDLHINGGTFNLGHRHPPVVAALEGAIAHLDIGNHHLPSAYRADCAEALVRHAPGNLRYVVFATGGSEAVDVAIKSARWATKRRKVVAIEAGYHGRTGLSGAAGDDKTAAFFHSDQPDQFLKVPFNDLPAMRAVLAANDVAAVVMETIPATCGFPTPQDGYLPGVKEACREHGALYVADEVQTGLGRTGVLWGVERFGVEPDILVTGKGLSGGMYPIAAAILSHQAGAWLEENGWGHVSTFGGSEIGCVVASKVLEISADPGVLANVGRQAGRFAAGLADVQRRRPFLVEVRQTGLVIGLKFDHPFGAIHMMRCAYDSGLWAFFAGFDPSVLQFKPGLLVDDALCDEILERLDAAVRLGQERPLPARLGGTG